MTYPIADLIIRLKNAYQAQHQELVLPYSNVAKAVVNLLKQNQYINDFSPEGQGIKRQLRIKLNQSGDGLPIKQVVIYSRPGRRIYHKSNTLPWGQNPQALIIISTSAGIMSHRQAVARKLGGEVIAQIY